MVRQSVEVKKNPELNLTDRLQKIVGESDVLGSPTIEKSKEIDEKNVLKYMVETAESYLQRSMAIMIKSAMSRLFGTRETLQKLHELNSELLKLPKSSRERVEVIKQYESTINESCKLWDTGWSVDEDWVWRCRQILPRDKRKGGPQEQWKDLSEDLSSWKLDICLKLIDRAKYRPCANCKHAKCSDSCECAEHKLFSSRYLCFNNVEQPRYDIVALANKATEVRNFYAHNPTYIEIVERIEEHFEIIERFASELIEWVTYEDKKSHNKISCQEGLDNIKMRRKGYLVKHMAKWNNVLDGLKNLNFNDFGYILVSAPCNKNAGVVVSKEELAQLSNIPWAAIVDFDASSKEDGLLYSLCELEEDQFRIKVSCQSSSKNTVVPFSYANIDGVGRGELCRDGHIPWIFPHGECQNQSNIEYPLGSYQQHCTEVQKPVIVAMRKIASHITQNNNKGAVSVVLCYGSYAHENENLPYFLSDLKCLCDELLREGGNVVILSDSLFLVKHLKPLPVLIFPLHTLCYMVQNKLTFGQNELHPINMPGPDGNMQPITFDEEDFELIHEHIAEHELHKHRVERIIELQQHNEVVSDTIVRSDILYQSREIFYKGQRVTWNSLCAEHAITRREENEITIPIVQMLQDRVCERVDPAKYTIYHVGGAGATTVARKILWHLRVRFPCVILKANYKGSKEKVERTSQDLRALYEKLQNPILMLIDEEPTFKTIPRLTQCVHANGTPVVFLQVQRYDASEPVPAEQQVKGSSDCYILPSVLCQVDANNLKHKFYSAFGKDKMYGGDCSIAKMESSVLIPTKNDKVFDLAQTGTLLNIVTNIKSGLNSYYTVHVSWENGETEICAIGFFGNKSNYRQVYLKKEINRLYQTFQFYGIMYLDEEFRQPMCKHIKKRLNEMSCEDEIAKKKLLILAYLSMLFSFKVCESIHIKAFEYLCKSVIKSSKSDVFKLESYIPESALEFIIITNKGQFRIIHPIVAHEIIKFCCTALSFPFPIPPSFVCDFLNYMLPEIEYQNEEAALAIDRLLLYRESVVKSGYFTKKPFSELILALDKQSSEHAIEVLDYASELINNCHFYGHYARYMSKKIKDYDKALEILKEADKLAPRSFEEGLVLNIKGDIYRERLKNFLSENDNLDWKNVDNNKAFDFHFNSCQAYRASYKNNHEDIPLFNEITVRLNLLEAIKRKHKEVSS